MHCVRCVQVVPVVSLSDREDLFSVCPTGTQEFSEDSSSLPEAAGVFPGCCVSVDAGAGVSFRGLAQDVSDFLFRFLGALEPCFARPLWVPRGLRAPPWGRQFVLLFLGKLGEMCLQVWYLPVLAFLEEL